MYSNTLNIVLYTRLTPTYPHNVMILSSGTNGSRMGGKLKQRIDLLKHRKKQLPKVDQFYLVYGAEIETQYKYLYCTWYFCIVSIVSPISRLRVASRVMQVVASRKSRVTRPCIRHMNSHKRHSILHSSFFIQLPLVV